jgi:hypothetical protein
MILENFKNGYEVSNGSLIAKGEKNDCVVRACANAFNISYDVAHKFVAVEFKRKARKGTKKVYSTFSALGKVAFDLFQDSLFPITKEYKLKCVNKPVNKEYTHKQVAYTVKTFCASFSKGTYIVLVNKHALVIKNGIVVDNPNNRFDGYRRVVESYVKVS